MNEQHYSVEWGKYPLIGRAADARPQHVCTVWAKFSRRHEAAAQHQQHQPDRCYCSRSDCPDSDDSRRGPTTTWRQLITLHHQMSTQLILPTNKNFSSHKTISYVSHCTTTYDLKCINSKDRPNGPVREWHRHRCLTPLLPCKIYPCPRPQPVPALFVACCPHHRPLLHVLPPSPPRYCRACRFEGSLAWLLPSLALALYNTMVLVH